MTTPQEPPRGGEPPAERTVTKRNLVNLFLRRHLPAISIGLGMGLTAVVLPDSDIVPPMVPVGVPEEDAASSASTKP